MAQITINIPDAVATRVLNKFTAYYGYSSTLADGSPNPQTRVAFAKQKLAEYVKAVVTQMEMREARATAEATAEQSASNLDIS